MITMEAFFLSKTKPDIFLIMHADHLDRWKEYCENYDFKIPHTLIPGGKTRSESVFKGLKEMVNQFGEESLPDWIAVHDAVRPLLSPDFIDSGFNFAKKMGNSIPGLPLRDSIRKVDQTGSFALPRENYKLIQTPQIFPGKDLLKAYLNTIGENFSDDASLFESCNHTIHLMEGEQENIKITYPLDLLIAEQILNKRENDQEF